ncbi:MAG: glycosyltransferase family 4 protein [Prevotella sp.]|nr:glycosyltransferase family 4 protein [Prevotella sp.]
MTQNKKIFHIVSNKEWGGGEQYVYDLSQRQKADGIEVSIFCKPVDAIVGRYEAAGLKVMPMSLGGALDVGSAWRMAAVLKQAGPCAVHAHNFKDAFTACYARKLSGAKEVRVVMCRHLTRKGKNTLLYRWLYGQLDCLCFDSELSKQEFLSTSPSIDPQKMAIVHTSIVVPEKVEPVSLRDELGIADDCVVAMFHGRLDAEKGLDGLLEAVAQLSEKPFRLVLVGRGSDEYTAHLQQRVKDLHIAEKVVFAGFRHPVLPYVAAADFGILASTVKEGCPLSPQEYMSQGHPVVVTNNGGQREYVEDGRNGLLVPPGDVQALAQAIGRLVDNDALRGELGRQAKADFDDHLNYEHYYTQIKSIYERQKL